MLRAVPDTTATFADLRRFLTEPGCAVCRCAAQTTARFFEALLDEYINDPETRQELRDAGGFCPFHAGELLGRKNPLGTAILLADLLAQRRTQLERGRALPGSAAGGRCPVCAAERETERRAAEVFARGMDGGTLQEEWAASEGLCWPHFCAVRPLARRSRATLDAHQGRCLDAILGDLRALIDSFDYRYHGGRTPEVESAWRRAVPRAVGERRLPPAVK